jgi:hypothetical protein
MRVWSMTLLPVQSSGLPVTKQQVSWSTQQGPKQPNRQTGGLDDATAPRLT